ncbi:VOC family protein [Limnovirga soli]|uniref:VOC family protein n=1 Tax=Limnovirga soli TaxID=2656915 RepID=A0A8J8JRN3_9BACT|nr:VOC family protein [Limnovirga soli]NNV56057.1 VOC family protein [Limnovirga soli]
MSMYPCLWFNGNAKEAATFYCSVFNNSKIISDTPLVVQFAIEGKKIMGLNGGPMFTINPSISFFVTLPTVEEIETAWNKLADGGNIMMALDTYPWAQKYGWVVDKFGMTWQLMLGSLPEGAPKIIMSFLFAGQQYGKAQEAINFYTTTFPHSHIHHIEFYQENEPQPAGNLKFGHFTMLQEMFAAMDGIGDHQFQFNEAVSLVVECETQAEIDNYWDILSRDGKESQCGWLTDKFGVSWQIVPSILARLMTTPGKAGSVTQAFMKMKKMDIATLIAAAEAS